MKQWNDDKSLWLSRVCVVVFSVLLALLCVGVPLFTARWETFVLSTGIMLAQVKPLLFTVFYGVALCAAWVLWHLYCLLKNISKNSVFVANNVAHLRSISWGCLLAGVCFLGAVWFAPTVWVLSAAAAFVGLILRVVKNVFAEAVALQEETDYTI